MAASTQASAAMPFDVELAGVPKVTSLAAAAVVRRPLAFSGRRFAAERAVAVASDATFKAAGDFDDDFNIFRAGSAVAI